MHLEWMLVSMNQRQMAVLRHLLQAVVDLLVLVLLVWLQQLHQIRVLHQELPQVVQLQVVEPLLALVDLLVLMLLVWLQQLPQIQVLHQELLQVEELQEVLEEVVQQVEVVVSLDLSKC